jgi:hypothetical protein
MLHVDVLQLWKEALLEPGDDWTLYKVRTYCCLLGFAHVSV